MRLAVSLIQHWRNCWVERVLRASLRGLLTEASRIGASLLQFAVVGEYSMTFTEGSLRRLRITK